MLTNRNTICVISKKIKNCTGDYERHSEFAELTTTKKAGCRFYRDPNRMSILP